MERNSLLNKLIYKNGNKEEHMSLQQRKEILQTGSIKLQPNQRDVAVAIEEISELVQLFTKVLRGRQSVSNLELELMEEIADVRISLETFSCRFNKDIEDIETDSLLIYTADNNKYDNSYTIYVAIKIVLTELLKLSNSLALSLYFDYFSSDWVYKDIIAIYKELNGLIKKLNLDIEKIKYIEDIKLERISARIRNGEKL